MDSFDDWHLFFFYLIKNKIIQNKLWFWISIFSGGILTNKIICILAGTLSINAFGIDNQNFLNISKNTCELDKCDFHLKNTNEEKLGNLFISKKTNLENNASQYIVVIDNQKTKNTSKYLITCLSDYTCKSFKYENGDLADFAFSNNAFKTESLTNEKANIRISNDLIPIYLGSNSVFLEMP